MTDKPIVLSNQQILDIISLFGAATSPKIRCTECNGKGQLDIDMPDEYPVRCEECEGYGYIQYAVNQAERIRQVRETMNIIDHEASK